jgi:hypothetical protein
MMVGLKETEAVVAIGQNVYANDLVTQKRVNCSNKRRHLCLRRKAAWGKGLRDITIIIEASNGHDCAKRIAREKLPRGMQLPEFLHIIADELEKEGSYKQKIKDLKI